MVFMLEDFQPAFSDTAIERKISGNLLKIKCQENGRFADVIDPCPRRMERALPTRRDGLLLLITYFAFVPLSEPREGVRTRRAMKRLGGFRHHLLDIGFVENALLSQLVQQLREHSGGNLCRGIRVGLSHRFSSLVGRCI